MKTKNFITAIVAVASICFFACNSEADLLFDEEIGQEIEIPADIDDETFVSLQKATEVADAFFGGESGLKSAGSQKTIVSAETVKDGGSPLIYVMNYNEGGVVIVGATKNYYPVLAYSEESSFVLAPDMWPELCLS